MNTVVESPPQPIAAERLLAWLRARLGEAHENIKVKSNDSGLHVTLTEGRSVMLARAPANGDAPEGTSYFPNDATALTHTGACLNDSLGPVVGVPLISDTGKKRSLVSVTQAAVFDSGLRVELSLSAGACGFASFDLAGTRVHWETRPKIEKTNWVGLLAMAHGWPSLAMGRTGDHAETEETLVEVLVRAYLGGIQRLLQLDPSADRVSGGGLRRAYDPRAELLRSRLRGQLDRPAYLRQLARGRPDRVPCRFHTHDLDNLPNRALRWGLHLCRSLLSGVRAIARSDLEDALRVADARFAGVSWTRVTRADLPKLRHPPRSLRAYEQTGALPLARFLLQHVQLGGPAGGPTSVALAFDMPTLFERAFAQGAAAHFEQAHAAIAQRVWRLRLETESGETNGWGSSHNDLRPDLYLPADTSALPEATAAVAVVADTKWKAVDKKTKSSGTGDEPTIQHDEMTFKVRREDLYQVLAYALTARGQQPDAHVRVALVYPTSHKANVPLDATLCWTTDGPTAHEWLDLRIVGWPVDGDVQSSLKVLMTKLSAPLIRTAT
jgi:5-methylcytosine-specific restriction endonuclease McrBC regulatory subunit McrC